MSRDRPLRIQLYRQEPGDVGIKDIFVPGFDLGVAKELTRNRLADWFENRKPNPHHARLTGPDDAMIATYRVNLRREVELVPEER